MAGDGAPSVGILPIGALGVAFFYHLTEGLRRVDGNVVLVQRRGAVDRWSGAATLRVEAPSGPIDLPLTDLLVDDLAAIAGSPAMPDVILVTTNPDQLFTVLTEFVGVVEHEHREGRLESGRARLPVLVLCSNGIYFQRTRANFIELLEEATLLGRLPDLWPDLMPQLVGRVMRGVTIQTSVRRGSGPSALYRPGPSGRTRITGGDRATRARVVAQLAELGGWFEDAGSATPTRVEFDKALVNLASNVFGQLDAIDGSGAFRTLTVAEIVRPQQFGRIRDLVTAVVRVGQGVGAYHANETSEEIFNRTIEWLKPAAAHVPSSVQWIEQQLAEGTLIPGLAPTETWLMKPLQHYAKSLGDVAATAYFEQLEADVIAAVSRAVARQETGRI